MILKLLNVLGFEKNILLNNIKSDGSDIYSLVVDIENDRHHWYIIEYVSSIHKIKLTIFSGDIFTELSYHLNLNDFEYIFTHEEMLEFLNKEFCHRLRKIRIDNILDCDEN
jgi:hypothetical protein